MSIIRKVRFFSTFLKYLFLTQVLIIKQFLKDYSKDRLVFPKKAKEDKKLMDKLRDFYSEVTKTTQTPRYKEKYNLAEEEE